MDSYESFFLLLHLVKCIEILGQLFFYGFHFKTGFESEKYQSDPDDQVLCFHFLIIIIIIRNAQFI